MSLSDIELERLRAIDARLIPRHVNSEGASAPDAPLWRVDPPSNSGFEPRSFSTYRQAEEYAMTCPPRTRIIHPDTSENAALYTESLTAEFICRTAAQLVSGDRAATHGGKLTNFSNTADLWNGYWRIKCRVSGERLVTPFTALDVGNMMELLKIARRFSGSFNVDDYIDAAGYAGCTGEIAANEQKTPPNTD